MKRIVSKSEDYNIYCTSADSSEHSSVALKPQQLLRQIKLCSLLGKHVYISCGHIYENLHTQSVLLNNPDLLESGIVAIGIRSDCRDFSDLADMRAKEGRLDRDSACVTSFLDKHTSVVIPWKPMDMQPQFKSHVMEMLRDSKSCLRKRLTGTCRQQIDDLCKAIDETPDEFATRTAMHSLAKKHVPRRIRAFMREINLLYYIMGTYNKSLKPHISPVLFSDLGRGWDASIGSRSVLPIEEAAQATLRESMLPVEVLEHLSVAQLANLRESYSNVFAQFRQKWWKVAAQFESRTEVALRDQLIDVLVEEVRKEHRRIKMYDATANCIGVSSLVMSGLSYIPNPAIAAISFMVSLLAYGASIKKIKHGIADADFSALTDCIMRNVKPCDRQ